MWPNLFRPWYQQWPLWYVLVSAMIFALAVLDYQCRLPVEITPTVVPIAPPVETTKTLAQLLTMLQQPQSVLINQVILEPQQLTISGMSTTLAHGAQLKQQVQDLYPGDQVMLTLDKQGLFFHFKLQVPS